MKYSTEIIESNEEAFFDTMQKEKEKWVIDVRREEDFNKFHLPQALHLDILSPNAIDGISLLRIEKPVFLYCNSGIRSKSACKLFEQMGFKKVYHLTKGINACKNLEFSAN